MTQENSLRPAMGVVAALVMLGGCQYVTQCCIDRRTQDLARRPLDTTPPPPGERQPERPAEAVRSPPPNRSGRRPGPCGSRR
jgi:hypothetical protein